MTTNDKSDRENSISTSLASLASTQKAVQPQIVTALLKLGETQRLMQPAIGTRLASLAATQKAVQPQIAAALSRFAETQRLMQPPMPRPQLPRLDDRLLRGVIPNRLSPSTPVPIWRLAPKRFRDLMVDGLAAVDPNLPSLLDAAWERVSRGGPNAASHAANSLVEVIDWTIRQLAPDEEALRWHTQHGRPAFELHEGRPTRRLRICFILRERDPDGSAATAFAKWTGDLVDLLQATKHRGGQGKLALVASLIPNVEGILCLLLGTGTADLRECAKCGGRMVSTGSCYTCRDCGTNTGCS